VKGGDGPGEAESKPGEYQAGWAEGSFGASNTGKLLYNPRALPNRFA